MGVEKQLEAALTDPGGSKGATAFAKHAAAENSVLAGSLYQSIKLEVVNLLRLVL
jgi:hypothetical protein